MSKVMPTADTKVVALSLRSIATAALSLVLVAATAVQAPAASVLALYYDADTGSVKLQNTTSDSLAIQGFNIITVGDGTLGDPSGRPGDIGWLSGSAANLPPAGFTLSNTSPAGYNGLNSQAYAENFASAIFTLTPYAGWSPSQPIGPAGSFWDLGTIAVPGMSQADLDARFLTDPDLTPPNFDATAYGKFLFSYEISPGDFSGSTLGDVTLQAVPEPTAYAIGIVAVACANWAMRHGSQLEASPRRATWAQEHSLGNLGS